MTESCFQRHFPGRIKIRPYVFGQMRIGAHSQIPAACLFEHLQDFHRGQRFLGGLANAGSVDLQRLAAVDREVNAK